MIIEIQKDTTGSPFICMTAENVAESYQLQAFKGQLIWADVSFAETNGYDDPIGLRFNLSRGASRKD